MLRVIIVMIGLTAFLLSTGCATIVSDNDTSVYLSTEPEKAHCDLNGKNFIRTINTPASLVIPANAAPVTVTCEAENYVSTTDTLDTAMDGWILGNILFGGVIGVVIDAASGSGQKYPSEFRVVLQPSRFESVAERDRWFDNRRKQLENKWEQDLNQARATCNNVNIGGSEDTSCKNTIKKAEALRDSELQALEAGRQEAVITQYESDEA